MGQKFTSILILRDFYASFARPAGPEMGRSGFEYVRAMPVRVASDRSERLHRSFYLQENIGLGESLVRSAVEDSYTYVEAVTQRPHPTRR